VGRYGTRTSQSITEERSTRPGRIVDMKWYPIISKTFVDLAGTRRLVSKVAKINEHTYWVKIMIGATKSIVVKRHLKKHHVITYIRQDMTEGVDDAIT
jgi:hypothetical protein